MGLREEKRIDKRFFDYSAGAYCGVVVPIDVMKKLAKIHSKYTSEIRKVLDDHKEDLLVKHWTLANQMDGDKIVKQVTINYGRTDQCLSEVAQRIALFTTPRPTSIDEFFMVDTYEEAQQIAQEILEEEIAKEK